MNTLAVINGSEAVRAGVTLLLVALAGAVLWYIGWYFFSKMGKPMVVMVWNGLFVLVGGLLLINFLLSLAGHPLIAW